jgi:hypothetical protein
MEQRHPADSRLAIHWLERFEAYFMVWTPVYAFGADLTAYRQTLIDPSSEWEQTTCDGSTIYTKEVQADGYGAFALFNLACALGAERHFIARYGGLWLLSSPEAEAQTRDALHAITLATSMNERDRSWLRTVMQDADGELHGFLSTVRQDPIGRATWEEWKEWLDGCTCFWQPLAHDPAVEYFPTGRYHGGITPTCSLHQAIEACNNFCTLIEGEWMKVADWYGIDSQHRPAEIVAEQ